MNIFIAKNNQGGQIKVIQDKEDLIKVIPTKVSTIKVFPTKAFPTKVFPTKEILIETTTKVMDTTMTKTFTEGINVRQS